MNKSQKSHKKTSLQDINNKLRENKNIYSLSFSYEFQKKKDL